jgi:hypothetical protein
MAFRHHPLVEKSEGFKVSGNLRKGAKKYFNGDYKASFLALINDDLLNPQIQCICSALFFN